MGLALLVWVGGGLLKRVLYLFKSKISDPAPASYKITIKSSCIVRAYFSDLLLLFYSS